MERSGDSYKTLAKASQEVLFKDRKSKFYGYAYPLSHESEIKPLLDKLRDLHPTANHICYAWKFGVGNFQYRVNDDGEPNNSAGMPIYGQIQSYELTNIFVAVVRIFGGTKLGVGGLITAYKSAAKMALESSTVIEKKMQAIFLISFPYVQMEKVMRIVKRKQLQIVSQKMELNCVLKVLVNYSEVDDVQEAFAGLREIKIRRL